MFSRRQLTNTRPTSREHLLAWLGLHTGVKLSTRPVCCGHHSQADVFEALFIDKPSTALVLGARGSGKSFISALDSHLTSRFYPNYITNILGGSLQQSQQIYQAIKNHIIKGAGPDLGNGTRLHDRDTLKVFGVEKAEYKNGSQISVLCASSKSVRGPHGPGLKMDEVDEIDPEIRKDALGMCMRIEYPESLIYTSTWHRVGGPMSEKIEEYKAEGLPFYTMCLFDVMECCPEDHSGAHVGGDDLYEKCPQCPLKKWCHSERDKNGNRALAKMGDGHYSISASIQKTREVGMRMFEADYLCRGPRVEGLIFPNFGERNVSSEAEFDPKEKVWFSLDTGLRTAAVWFQIKRVTHYDIYIDVFAEYYAEGLTPQVHVRGGKDMRGDDHEGILRFADRMCGGRMDERRTDPGGEARTSVGAVTIREFEAAGLIGMKPWPKVRILDALNTIDSLILAADGKVYLRIHPRCKGLIRALSAYRRAEKNGVLSEGPLDPQHPHENYVDALKNGVVAAIGLRGRLPEKERFTVDARKIL